MAERLERLRTSLLESAFLFEDPYSYRAGVEDALVALEAELLETGDDARQAG